MNKNNTNLLAFDKKSIWHPYTSMSNPLPTFLVDSAQGVHIELASGEKLIDGMSSWWAVIHGYNNAYINQAIVEQTDKMAHIMFGGLTHQPAISLCKTLVDITPSGLDKVFLSDSGSVAVEVAMKMALQYWQAQGIITKSKFLTLRNGYHGDTFAAMSVCDPVTGMHQLFEDVLAKQIFANAPQAGFKQAIDEQEIIALEQLFVDHHKSIAAFILEPIVQGAGGMRIYNPEYLKIYRSLASKYNVLLIIDEIATGFGRTGKLFACEHANISPDILCLGKALTGGYVSLAATLTTEKIANTISNGAAGCFMHGPTFMGNPLACAVANASLALLTKQNWQQKVDKIAKQLTEKLLPLQDHYRVQNVRVLGAIGVVEVKQSVNMAAIQQRFVELGVWIRPFGKLIYIMPPYIIEPIELKQLINAISIVLDEEQCFSD
jgi:adenosylmethionine-8-amino-7-oxononanoate aminotransferase